MLPQRAVLRQLETDIESSRITVEGKTLEVPEAERIAFWEKLYAEPGFGIWMGNFRDTLTDEAANAEISKFIANKIRQRVKNQTVAEKLIPKDHGFGVSRNTNKSLRP